MNRQIGHHQQILVNIYRPAFQLIVPAANHPPRHGKASVEPGCVNHASVGLHIQLYIVIFHIHLGFGFQLKGRRIAVGSRDMKSLYLPLWNPERYQGRIVSLYIIAFSRFQLPAFIFL